MIKFNFITLILKKIIQYKSLRKLKCRNFILSKIRLLKIQSKIPIIKRVINFSMNLQHSNMTDIPVQM